MGLRRFHLAFISISVVLAVFMASWAFGQYRSLHSMEYLVTAVGCMLAGAGLIAYGAAFQRKTKAL
jgi:hypothetical protein